MKSSRGRLAREIAIVLAIKFAALFAIWTIWFANPPASEVDGPAMRALLGVIPARNPERSTHDAGS